MSRYLFTSALIAFSAFAANLSSTAESHTSSYSDSTDKETGKCNPGLEVTMYELPDGAKKLPLAADGFHLKGVTKLDQWEAKRIGWDIYEDSLRGQKDNFILDYQGWVMIPEKGLWKFGTKSDDGSRLWIDKIDNLVVDNDGVHGAKEVTGTRYLQAGLHKLYVKYFEKDWGAMMELYMGGPYLDDQPVPKFEYQVVPSKYLYNGDCQNYNLAPLTEQQKSDHQKRVQAYEDRVAKCQVESAFAQQLCLRVADELLDCLQSGLPMPECNLNADERTDEIVFCLKTTRSSVDHCFYSQE